MVSGMSPTSSRNSVPPCAASTSPALAACAPVKAPFSWPNSSLSNSVSGRLAQSTTTSGRPRRRSPRAPARATRVLCRCPIRRPAARTLASEGPTRATSSSISRNGAERPISPFGRGRAVRHAQRLHALDEPGGGARGVAHRHQLDADVGLALRRVVQVQHALALAAAARRASGQLAGLVGARRCGATPRSRCARAPRRARRELRAVGRVRRDDAVARVEQDVRLGRALEVGGELGPHCGGGAWSRSGAWACRDAATECQGVP